jgi:hypothetical protein
MPGNYPAESIQQILKCSCINSLKQTAVTFWLNYLGILNSDIHVTHAHMNWVIMSWKGLNTLYHYKWVLY